MNPGIYVHIPFCKSRCSYCDFATDVFKSEETIDRYVAALCREIDQSGEIINNADTLYFGGGTPSLLSPKQLERLLKSLYKKFSFESGIEFTLEMNPATVSAEKLKDYRKLGVNRASFGVQTFNDRALKLLARGHDSNDARNTFDLLRKAGFENISFDLIAGLPNQGLADWESNLDEALRMGPEHLSLYILEIHEATPLAGQIRSERQPMPDEELAAEMYELMLEKVAEKGFLQYEISNFSKAGLESRHNSKYWLCGPVFAFGNSAHGFDGKERWSNERDTNKYVSLIESGKSPVTNREEIDLASEYIFLGLRLNQGIDADEYMRKFGIDMMEKYGEGLSELKESGLIEMDEKRIRLTKIGMVFSNEVFQLFI